MVEWQGVVCGLSPVPRPGYERRDLTPEQANNFCIFPAIELATYAALPRRIADDCFIVAAEAAADQVGSATLGRTRRPASDGVR